ncbi:FecR family protein [Chryseolinea lacunae]|uniref:FecR domain-containing protein n=1 Tax=Chryseolinea lacunae TaxID=2801331 RepID=A0ABS1L261_9BACT|nr:FecR domain-containing protein [Chryseolinea lacunae]MBL0745602.1 FecR domain-containing protein [Chryseolinea lacunae]
MDTNTFHPEVFRKFLEGTCTADEKRMAEQYLENPEFASQIDALMQELWEDTTAPPMDRRAAEKRYEGVRGKVRPAHSFVLYKIAASVVLLVMSSYFAVRYWDVIRDRVDPVRYVSVQTKAGEQRLLKLPDGSQVWLNASSSLRYPEAFRGVMREVNLTGEAFFEVRRDEHKPFVVQTREFYTRVLGTSFNIEAYDDDATIDVTVATGKVAVGIFDTARQEQNQLALLTPNHHVRYDLVQHTWVKDSVAAATRMAWHEGRLVFKSCPLPEMIKRLERWYAVKINLAHVPTASCKVTAAFNEGTPLQDVLESVKLTGLITYAIRNAQQIDIVARGCDMNK